MHILRKRALHFDASQLPFLGKKNYARRIGRQEEEGVEEKREARRREKRGEERS